MRRYAKDKILSDGCCDLQTTRRHLIKSGVAAGAAFALLPSTALSSLSNSRDPRFLTIVLKGALDGMAAIPPVGDPDYSDLRQEFGLYGENLLPLDGLFAFNKNLPNIAKLYRDKQALIVHACSTSYRDRSHFDGQDILESGLQHKSGKTGWLNRACLQLLSGEKAKPKPAVFLGYSAPLIMRGKAPVMSWSPQAYLQPDQDTIDRLLALYDKSNPDLGDLLRVGVELDADEKAVSRGKNRQRERFLQEIDQTVEFFADPEGPRIAALSSGGWDTHAAQNPLTGRLARLLETLDAGVSRLHEGLGEIWHETVIAIVTEFGRTAAINGTNGTDHGNGTTAFLIGGAVNGGKIIADWPGLSSQALYDGRDLRATTHINAMFKGILRDHIGIDQQVLDREVFPDSQTIGSLDRLVV